MTVLAMFILGLITFFYRYSFISAQGKKIAEKIPVSFLQLIAPATFAAIIFNGILASQSNPAVFRVRLLVAALALVVAYWTESILATVVVGLAVLYLLV